MWKSASLPLKTVRVSHLKLSALACYNIYVVFNIFMERKKCCFLPVRIQSKCSMSDQGIHHKPWGKQPSARVKNTEDQPGWPCLSNYLITLQKQEGSRTGRSLTSTLWHIGPNESIAPCPSPHRPLRSHRSRGAGHPRSPWLPSAIDTALCQVLESRRENPSSSKVSTKIQHKSHIHQQTKRQSRTEATA